ncbi:MAG: hypothetical protein H6905_10550 [Hyphomicrobiales bacterium]|nr:hypothetical protein [Hyphomicrobiales bacterium]
MNELNGETETMKDDKTKHEVSRRDLLRGAGFSGAVMGIAAAAATAKPTNAAMNEPKTRPAAGYHETEHVRKAYALARF